MIGIVGPKLRTKGMLCKYIEIKKCSFNGAALCKGTGWSNPEECILYQLIEDNEKLKERVRKLELSVNGVSTTTTTTLR